MLQLRNILEGHNSVVTFDVIKGEKLPRALTLRVHISTGKSSAILMLEALWPTECIGHHAVVFKKIIYDNLSKRVLKGESIPLRDDGIDQQTLILSELEKTGTLDYLFLINDADVQSILRQNLINIVLKYFNWLNSTKKTR
ncbi:hypothetical protein Tco_0719561 [Tanacetum coccineum]